MHESLAAMWCVTPFVCMTGRRNKCLSWSTMWANNTQKIKNQKPVAKNINNACTSFTIIKSGISGIKDHQWHLPPSNWLKLIKLPKWTYLTYIQQYAKKMPHMLWFEYMQIHHEQNTHVTNKYLLYTYIHYIRYKVSSESIVSSAVSCGAATSAKTWAAGATMDCPLHIVPSSCWLDCSLHIGPSSRRSDCPMHIVAGTCHSRPNKFAKFAMLEWSTISQEMRPWTTGNVALNGLDEKQNAEIFWNVHVMLIQACKYT